MSRVTGRRKGAGKMFDRDINLAKKLRESEAIKKEREEDFKVLIEEVLSDFDIIQEYDCTKEEFMKYMQSWLKIKTVIVSLQLSEEALMEAFGANFTRWYTLGHEEIKTSVWGK